MLLGQEVLKKSSKLFFTLLKKQFIPLEDELVKLYIENSEVEEAVKTMAQEADLYVFTSNEHIHLVSKGTGSIFANTYTQMKENYSDLKTKKYFYLANLIICVFLAEIDSDQLEQMGWNEKGVAYGRIEREVTSLIQQWKDREKEGEEFSKNFSVSLKDIDQVWNVEFSRKKEGKSNVAKTTANKLGFIYKALKPLADQKLIINRQEEELVFPRPLLYERIIELYHSQPRYRMFKKLIKETLGNEREEEENAEDQ